MSNIVNYSSNDVFIVFINFKQRIFTSLEMIAKFKQEDEATTKMTMKTKHNINNKNN